MTITPLGKHFLVELYDCDQNIINSKEEMETIMRAIAINCKTTIIDTKFHHFSPHGISGVILIAESHLTVHTWPEYKYVALDFFTCNIELDLITDLDMIKKLFKAKDAKATLINRGLFSPGTIDNHQ